jgi:hypothetical protein
MLITSSIPNLINGVSQQPATLRLASQAEEQINFLSSVSDGLKRRPGGRHLSKISSTPEDDAFIHTINRDRNEKYLVTVRDGNLSVFNAKTGVQQQVNFPHGNAYLSNTSKDSFRAVTVADYTFILNRDRIAQMQPTLTPPRLNQALVYVRAGNYGKAYNIIINNSLRARMYTPDGSVPEHVNWVRTEVIADNLVNSLVTGGTTTHHPYQSPMVRGGGDFSTFSYYTLGSMVVISSSSQTPFTVRVDDGSGGVNLIAVGANIQRFSELPKVAPNGFSTEIVGDNTSSFDNYFSRFTDEGGAGVWKETVKSGETFQFNPDTVPHVLIREANGTFTFRRGDWIERKVGDKGSIPDPSFIGRQISDIFFYRNRLGMLADENIILSKQGEFFDFYRDTATTLLDTDPIDLAVSNSKVSILNHALPFNKSLLLFSEGAQFILESGDILSAETAYVSQSTQFESATGVRPVGVGQYVYFPVARGSFTGMREYFVENGNEQNDALDVTSHVPRYLPKGLFKLAASTSEDILVGVSSETPRSLWVYKFFFSSEGKLQSSWSRWDLGAEGKILSADFIDTALYLVVSRADGTYIEAIDIESGYLDEDASFHYHVDRGLYVSGGFFDGSTTTFTLPYSTELPLWVFIGGGDTEYPEGLSLPFTRPSSTTFQLEGDWTGRRIFCGTRFRSEYTFSTFYLRSNEPGGGVSAVDDGRLQIRRLYLNFTKAGFFEVTSYPTSRSPSTKTFSGITLADESARLGAFKLSEGRFSVPVLARNKDLKVIISTDSFMPCSFTSAEWEATYHTRAKRL